ncbi:MAG: 2Fe-2S iron-sulfur cluster-binding protein, partial [Motiliproteus sp.]|nr:2Fe-2S iron-sulfur cluster-binding protein [Motiliproteus sp.]
VLVVHLLKMRHATKLLQHLVDSDSAKELDTPAPPPVPAPRWNGRLQVTRIFQETPDIKTFRLVNADGGPVPFTYEPGQFLSIRMNVEGETVKRTYTIASAPTQRYYCELTIKREELGKMSRFMHQQVNEGDLIEADKPGGKFTFDGSEAESIVLIGGGVGITPLMAVLRYLTDAGWKKPIYFLFACKTLDDFIFRRELEYLDARNDNLHLHCFVSALEESVFYAEQGRISAERITALVPEIQSRRVHLCGSPPMMDAVKAMLAELSVPKDQIKIEAFGTGKPKQTVSLDSAVESDPKVTFQQSQQTAPFPECCTLLDVAENIGVEIESSCLMGSCGMCMTKLVSGEVTMECEDALDDNDRAAGMILACQAKAKSDVVVDA